MASYNSAPTLQEPSLKPKKFLAKIAAASLLLGTCAATIVSAKTGVPVAKLMRVNPYRHGFQ
jgi:hypothetical protein